MRPRSVLMPSSTSSTPPMAAPTHDTSRLPRSRRDCTKRQSFVGRRLGAAADCSRPRPAWEEQDGFLLQHWICRCCCWPVVFLHQTLKYGEAGGGRHRMTPMTPLPFPQRRDLVTRLYSAPFASVTMQLLDRQPLPSCEFHWRPPWGAHVKVSQRQTTGKRSFGAEI